MSVEIVVHRGMKNILYDNSIIGILAAISKKKFCEFDIVFVDGKWKVCHDFQSITIYHSSLSDLLSLFKQYQHLVQHTIIIDVKWDYIWNRHDSLDDAIQQLHQELVGFEEYPFWLQASHTKILEVLATRCGHAWKLGMIVFSMHDFIKYQKFLHFAMVPLSHFDLDHIITFSQQCLVFGYTCRKTNELCAYKHLFPYLKGIVCDVSL